MSVPSLQLKLSDVVAEYEAKIEAIPDTLSAYQLACSVLQGNSCVQGTYGNTRIDTGNVHEHQLKESLLKSAWLHVYKRLKIDRVASANDKKRFEQFFEKPDAFTIENLRDYFGDYLLDPRGNILRGLAEVFCQLDPAYKSHDKVRVGVSGLPKRIIFPVSDYGYGRDRLTAILNALASYQGKPMVEWSDVSALLKDGNALKDTRGIWLKRFSNGNGHLFFNADTLKDINRALAEYYGEVLPDCTDDGDGKKQASTAVSKDLQYYPTPANVVERVIGDFAHRLRGERVLEPSCGCGRIMDALRKAGADVFGIEVDATRANQARAKGHHVQTANFLETIPTGDYDRVVMNPPFYGQHYAKHVTHALKYLKEGGVLTAILPVTARYDHGLLDGRWEDLPVGSFRESGTNVNTTVLTIRK